ncbi:MAG: YicC family protein [Burkholderiales bacterium]|nr:YicC family protein [Burkholderiales bacterium]
MVHSMTGYAAVAREVALGTLAIEVRSVNSRFLDLQFRIAEDVRAAEPQLRELVAAAVARGKVDFRVSFTPAIGAGGEAALDRQVLDRLAALTRAVRAAIPDAQPLRVSEVLHWPGVFGEDPGAQAALREALVGLAREALAELAATRQREGAKLAEMIASRVAAIRARLADIAPAVPQAIAAYQEKLAARLREVLAGGEEERIRQEIAMFGVKIDVAEELSRLAAHLDEVERVLAKGGPVGKRLDFLMQELAREANTLGSKSVSKQLADAALDFKLAIEQMREQVQNLE